MFTALWVSVDKIAMLKCASNFMLKCTSFSQEIRYIVLCAIYCALQNINTPYYCEVHFAGCCWNNGNISLQSKGSHLCSQTVPHICWLPVLFSHWTLLSNRRTASMSRFWMPHMKDKIKWKIENVTDSILMEKNIHLNATLYGIAHMSLLSKRYDGNGRCDSFQLGK